MPFEVILITDEIRLNEAVGEAPGWIPEKPMGAAVGFVPLTSNFAQICLGEVPGVGEGISKHEQPIVPMEAARGPSRLDVRGC
jgi:hypothetical protein